MTLTKEAKPLCSTCIHHEGQVQKVNIMWGGWKVGLGVLAVLVGLFCTMVYKNAESIATNKELISAHTRAMNGSLHEIEQVLNTVSINQKNLMKAANVEYLEPERIHRRNKE